MGGHQKEKKKSHEECSHQHLFAQIGLKILGGNKFSFWFFNATQQVDADGDQAAKEILFDCPAATGQFLEQCMKDRLDTED